MIKHLPYFICVQNESPCKKKKNFLIFFFMFNNDGETLESVRAVLYFRKEHKLSNSHCFKSYHN